MIRNVFAVSLCLFFLNINAQKPLENLTNWSRINPIEKVYLHTDRESYFAGESVWLKGYFQDGLVLSAKSTSLYVELLDNNSKVLIKNVFPAVQGVAFGQIDLPENLPSGSYQLRAYAPLMLNQPDFLFSKRITVYGKIEKRDAAKTTGKIGFSFFPEGGNLITGITSRVAFKITDENGLPLAANGEIRNNKNQLVTVFSTYHDGMGSFSITPLEGESYFAVLMAGGNDGKYALPESTKKGVVMDVENAGSGKRIRISQLPDNDPFRVAYITGLMENGIVFKQEINTLKNDFGVVIQTANLYSGILNVTVFNKDGIPLAARMIFVDNKDYVLPGKISVDTLNTGERKRNHFSVHLKDTIIGNFSVSITDADYEGANPRAQNIYSAFLLTGDLKGYIHNPAWYFNADSDSVSTGLDLVMMTNGWTRFKWTDVNNNSLPKPLIKDPGYINFSGKITIEGRRKPFANKELMMWLKPADTTRRGAMQIIKTDSLGRFRMDSSIFYGKNQVLFSDIKGKKSKFIEVKMDSDSLFKPYVLNPLLIPYYRKPTGEDDVTRKMGNAYNDFLKAEGLMLENVTVRGKTKSKTEQLESKYASGLFSGGIDSKVFDLSEENAVGSDIFQYLQGRVAGLMISGTPGDYKLSYRSGGLGNNNVSLFLDEMPVDASFIESIPVNQIAYVKLYPHFIGASGNSASLAVYTKKGADLNAVLPASTDIISYNGYTVIKEFFHPDYSVRKPEHSKADYRLTLSWRPYVNLAAVNPVIPLTFFNNDRTKRFKVVVEGMTNDGRMLMLEKIIDHD